MCRYNIHSSGKAFHTMLEPGYRDLFSFSHDNIGSGIASMQSGASLQVGVRCVEGSCAGQSSSFIPNLENLFFTDLALCTGVLLCSTQAKVEIPHCRNPLSQVSPSVQILLRKSTMMAHFRIIYYITGL